MPAVRLPSSLEPAPAVPFLQLGGVRVLTAGAARHARGAKGYFCPPSARAIAFRALLPAISKIGVVSRTSWTTPYEPSTLRSRAHGDGAKLSTQVNLFNFSHLETQGQLPLHGWAGGSLWTPTTLLFNLPLTLPQVTEVHALRASLTSRNLVRLYTLQHMRMGWRSTTRSGPTFALRVES